MGFLAAAPRVANSGKIRVSTFFALFLFVIFPPEPTATTSQAAKDNSGHKQFGRELYDLPKNGHIPSHYDLLPSREAPPSGCTEPDSE